MKKIGYILVCLLFACSFVSCEEDDDFSSDSSLQLQFESDSICFETVFATIESATKQFKIYNRNNKSLTISSIKLKNASQSGFKIGIDGEGGIELNNIDILRKDSLYAFVKIGIDTIHTNGAVVIKDTIEFITNGNRQYIHLESIGQNVRIWKGKTIISDATLVDDKPYLIYDSLVVSPGVTLTINEGVRLYFRKDASLQVYGNILAKGTVEKPILARGDRFDNIERDIPYDNVPGQWDGMFFHSESYGNYFENFQSRNAEVGMLFYESDPNRKKATLVNTIVHNTSILGVTAINCDIDATNSLFSNSKGATLHLVGGRYDFVYCTFANYFSRNWGVREGHALALSNTVDGTTQFPLQQCNVSNCIVYGSSSTELNLNKADNEQFDHQFLNCLIKSRTEIEAGFANIIWNVDPLFKDINGEGIYDYDFRLTEGSPAIDNAKKIASVMYDLNGYLRGSTPDIGCYEWLADE